MILLTKNYFVNMNCSLPGSSCHGILGKNTGVGSHFFPQGIFLTQGLNSGLLRDTQILYNLSHQEALNVERMGDYNLNFFFIHCSFSYMEG